MRPQRTGRLHEAQAIRPLPANYLDTNRVNQITGILVFVPLEADAGSKV